MNKLQRYEELIAAKLEQRPLPDMADAIWANIEKGLDADPPPHNPSQPPSSPVPVAGWIKGAGVLLIIAAIVIAIFRTRKHTDLPAPVRPAGTVPVIAPVTDSVPAVKRVLPNTNNPIQQPGKKINIADTSSIPDRTIDLPVSIIDTTSNSPLIVPPPAKTDSVVAVPPQSMPPPKKQKGVKLNSNDYKIVPVKKDS